MGFSPKNTPLESLMALKTIAVLFVFLISFSLNAQKTDEDYASGGKKSDQKLEPKVPFKDKLVFGGNIGGFLGTTTFIQINPMVGYKTKPWWVNGVGVNYMYVSSGNYNRSVYGASVWTRGYLFKSIILQSELEMLSVNTKFGNLPATHDNVPVWFVGGGYQSSGNGIRLSMLILYDLIQDPNSPYTSPVFRIGGLFGF